MHYDCEMMGHGPDQTPTRPRYYYVFFMVDNELLYNPINLLWLPFRSAALCVNIILKDAIMAQNDLMRDKIQHSYAYNKQ